jgi:hypothetical protein
MPLEFRAHYDAALVYLLKVGFHGSQLSHVAIGAHHIVEDGFKECKLFALLVGSVDLLGVRVIDAHD